MTPEQSLNVEKFMLINADWSSGTTSGNTSFGKHITNPILSLPLDSLSREERAEAVRILREKYEIAARIKQSASMGNIDVLRIESNGPYKGVEKLSMLLYLADASFWKNNIVTKGDTKLPASNFLLEKMSDTQVEYAKDLMQKWGIESEDKMSESLGNHRVLRIVGLENIGKLCEKFPWLRSSIQPGVPKQQVKGAHFGLG